MIINGWLAVVCVAGGEDGGAAAVVDEVVEIEGSTTEDDGQDARLDPQEDEAGPVSEGEGEVPDASTDPEDCPEVAVVEQQPKARASRPLAASTIGRSTLG